MCISIMDKIPSFAFFKMPKQLFIDEELKKLSMGAKLLYGLFLDRLSLSQRNGWYDKDRRLYIVFSREEIKDKLNCCNATAAKILKELESNGLISRKQGFSASIIYINMPEDKSVESEQQLSVGVDNLEPKSSESEDFVADEAPFADTVVQNINTEVQNSDGEGIKNRPTEVHKTDTNKTENIKTDDIKTEYNHLFDIDRDRRSFIESKYDSIREHISADTLSEFYGKSIVDNLVENIAEIALVHDDGRGYYKVSGKRYPISLVKMRFAEVDYDIADYVLNSLKHNCRDASKVKEYIIASVFNAADTIDIKSQIDAKHEMESGNLAEFIRTRLERRCAA